jgi:hypothetical protein
MVQVEQMKLLIISVPFVVLPAVTLSLPVWFLGYFILPDLMAAYTAGIVGGVAGLSGFLLFYFIFFMGND